MAVPVCLWQLQHTCEHRRNPLGVGDSIAFYRLESTQRVELFQNDDRSTERLRSGAKTQRSGVIQRRWG